MRSFLIGIFSSLSSWWGLGLEGEPKPVLLVAAAYTPSPLRRGSRVGVSLRHQIVNWFKSERFEYIAVFLFGIVVLGTALAVIQLIRTTRMRRAPRGRRVA